MSFLRNIMMHPAFKAAIEKNNLNMTTPNRFGGIFGSISNSPLEGQSSMLSNIGKAFNNASPQSSGLLSRIIPAFNQAMNNPILPSWMGMNQDAILRLLTKNRY